MKTKREFWYQPQTESIQAVPKKVKVNLSEEVSGFKKFLMRGNIVALGVGIIVGNAFNAIVNSFVNDLFMPFIGYIAGGINFTDLKLQIGNAVFAYGNFIQSIVNFLIIGSSVYLFMRLFETLFNRAEQQEEAKIKQPSEEVQILREIRDLLKKENESAS